MRNKVYTLSILFLASFFILSCEKEKEDEPAAKTPEEILTSSTWRIEEIRFLQNNTPYYYKRGATGNTANFDTESIKFNSDKTGTYIAGGITYTVTWEFIDAAKTKIRYVVNHSPALTVNWENVVFTESSIKYTEYYNRGGTYSLAYATRIK